MNTSEQPNLDSVGYPDISEGPYFVLANQIHLLPVKLQLHILFSLQEVYLQNLRRFFLAHYSTQRTPYTANDMTQMGFLPKSKLARASHRYAQPGMAHNQHKYVKTTTWSASHAMQVKEEVQRLDPRYSLDISAPDLQRFLQQCWMERRVVSHTQSCDRIKTDFFHRRIPAFTVPTWIRRFPRLRLALPHLGRTK